MTVDGSSAFYKSLTDSWFPNNHAPVGDGSSADYLFFDIGSFDRVAEVPNFDPDDTGDAAKKQGEILALSLALTGFSWAHFDVIALQTSYEEVFERGGQAKTLVSYLGEAIDENNPGSHDVTWKPENGGGTGQEVVPEPGTIMLLGTGLIGLALYGRRRMK